MTDPALIPGSFIHKWTTLDLISIKKLEETSNYWLET